MGPHGVLWAACASVLLEQVDAPGGEAPLHLVPAHRHLQLVRSGL